MNCSPGSCDGVYSEFKTETLVLNARGLILGRHSGMDQLAYEHKKERFYHGKDEKEINEG